MNIKINPQKLEVKYIIGNYKDLREYPTEKDIAYILLEWMIINNKQDDTILSDNFISKQVEKSIEEIADVLIKMVDDGILEHVKDTNTKSVYKMIKNPFE